MERRTSKLAPKTHKVDLDEAMECDEILLRIKQEKVGLWKMLQAFWDSLQLKDEKDQKKAALLCQGMLWDAVEKNLWCDDKTLLTGNHIFSMAIDNNWNFVMQLIVLLCDRAQLETICIQLSGRASELAKNVCGCRLLCRICEQGTGMQAAADLLMELSEELHTYALHRYGTFVVIKILKGFTIFPGMDRALFECTKRLAALSYNLILESENGNELSQFRGLSLSMELVIFFSISLSLFW